MSSELLKTIADLSITFNQYISRTTPALLREKFVPGVLKPITLSSGTSELPGSGLEFASKNADPKKGVEA